MSLFLAQNYEIVGTVNERVRIALSNGTHVHISFNFEISICSPAGSPWVFNIPELHTFFNSVSSCQNCMVDIFLFVSTAFCSVYTTFVVLESSDDFESNRNWSDIVKSLCKFSLVSLSDVIASMFAIGNIFWSIVHTFVSFGNIWICFIWF